MKDQTKTTNENRANQLERRDNVGATALKWVALPIAAYVVYELLFSLIVPRFVGPEFADADIGLLVYQAGLCVLVVGSVLLAQVTRTAGWTMPKGWFWIVIAGPLWLGVLTPIGAAIEFYRASPEKIAVLFAICFLVAVNEETLFRGCMFRGLQKTFRPLTAAIISSVVFGAIHIINLRSGGDPVFVVAQMFLAAGTGSVMAAVTFSSKSILPALFLHFIVDFVGLASLGGYEDTIQSAEIAPGVIITGLVFMAWGLFWCWRIQRKENAVLKAADGT